MRTKAEPNAFATYALFGLAIFSSASLIFLVQPMVGKRILPLLGGAPGVWSVCLAFYQTVLFLGYAYAHASSRFLSVRAQVFVHAVLVAVALVLPPVLPDAGAGSADLSRPISAILGMLGVHVAAPFFLLASTGPLVQHWFVKRAPERSPYPLYALSNLGSMLALFAYPILIEPRVGLERTGQGWSIGFVIVLGLVVACGFAAGWRAEAGGDPTGQVEARAPRPAASTVAAWLAFAATAVIAMMAVTNHLTRDIASVPFLWILPLAAYLATLVLCFSMDRAYSRRSAIGLVVGALGLGAAHGLLPSLGLGDTSIDDWLGRVTVEVGRLCALLFGTCWLLHGELHRRRPRSDDLTLFYLALSAGGALGGLFVGLVAPATFGGHHELVVAAVLSYGLALVAIGASASPGLRTFGLRAAWVVVALLVWVELDAAIAPQAHQIHQERSFFGVHRVTEHPDASPRRRELLHGSTIHGAQFTEPGLAGRPTTYFGRASALSAVLASRPRADSVRFGIVGLGVGTIATYARDADLVRFYEIDPAVVSIARDTGLFTFLANHTPAPEIVVADARLALAAEREAGTRQDFDFLIVDAFSSDAIPVHLLTVEAFRHYAAALADRGVIVVHISNRHFALAPVIARIAHELGFAHTRVRTPGVPQLDTKAARWMVLARDPKRLEEVAAQSRQRLARFGLPPGVHYFTRVSAEELEATALWTDDYSDLFGALIDDREGG